MVPSAQYVMAFWMVATRTSTAKDNDQRLMECARSCALWVLAKKRDCQLWSLLPAIETFGQCNTREKKIRPNRQYIMILQHDYVWPNIADLSRLEVLPHPPYSPLHCAHLISYSDSCPMLNLKFLPKTMTNTEIGTIHSPGPNQLLQQYII